MTMSMCDVPMLPWPVVSYQPGLWQTISSMPRFESTNSSWRSPSSFATTDSLKTNVFASSQRPAPGSQTPLPWIVR